MRYQERPEEGQQQMDVGSNGSIDALIGNDCPRSCLILYWNSSNKSEKKQENKYSP
ncbi:tsl1858 [Thermosynechococcus vestitus BP-1]|uniref:Tsl1858 protein n=1 Tax=Thermosynechococcus vestitus (strain NIES-2133 / IAM M-273 / BP-1) TaxID=197221 RepID=Q8DHT7_THEVB|nr:tsl1858 [Thermosynechococcus vestitus BP-1]